MRAYTDSKHCSLDHQLQVVFHDKIKAALRGLKGCISIHDNILVYGKTPEKHAANLKACLQRLRNKGLTLCRSKCTFAALSVSWFGYIFSKSSMSADPKKVAAILQAGRSETMEEVKSFLQACQYNAKFAFESEQAYAQVTKPLRELLTKNKKFLWSQACDDAYHEITSIMTSDSALRSFNPSKKTVMVTDTGPQGIATSIYQENDSST